MSKTQHTLTNTPTKLKSIIYASLKDATKTSLSIFKIMLPLSLLMTILNYLGVVNSLSTFLQPVASLLGIRGEGILVLLSGYLINTYSAIALMLSLDLSLKELSVLSAMILLAHTLPVELSIQKKAGGNAWLLFLIRIGSSIATGLILNLLLPGSEELTTSGMLLVTSSTATLAEILKAWLLENVTVLKIFVINIVLNIAFKLLIQYHILDKLSNLFKHIMFLFGLGKEVAPYFLVANMIGLIYGAGILITAKENQSLEKEEIRKLNVSICSMHSVIQETANFLPLGVNIFILIIPRLITSIISVWIYNTIIQIRKK